ncbi:hypothetical protein FJT64_009426 [Amphibalanus amphitrite]|uniref:Uncharacterized protein n=1 Tax=Amphibalanus amphitrite TaxID=1232801 RepID=A0A6A4V8L5_AMPAM|nr:hypothetical protein FJT64_009426 [Amphibalanus amphitrite]
MVKGLKISDTRGSNVIPMPRLYTLDKVPVDHSDIARIEDLRRWPHLQEVVAERVDVDIGLLIGANCDDRWMSFCRRQQQQQQQQQEQQEQQQQQQRGFWR